MSLWSTYKAPEKPPEAWTVAEIDAATEHHRHLGRKWAIIGVLSLCGAVATAYQTVAVRGALYAGVAAGEAVVAAYSCFSWSLVLFATVGLAFMRSKAADAGGAR